ncbi:MAG TPA: hypothetical protein VIJ77_08805 [Candidatus Tumulicola sp.]
MLALLLAIFLLGIAAGLRTFTAPAVLWLVRHDGIWAIVLTLMAVLEYAGDLHPKAPPRTGALGLVARFASGAFVGWAIAAPAGAAAAGAIAGIAGAAAGAFGGLAFRRAAIVAIGRVPAALLEDAVAIGLAVFAVVKAPA